MPVDSLGGTSGKHKSARGEVSRGWETRRLNRTHERTTAVGTGTRHPGSSDKPCAIRSRVTLLRDWQPEVLTHQIPPLAWVGFLQGRFHLGDSGPPCTCTDKSPCSAGASRQADVRKGVQRAERGGTWGAREPRSTVLGSGDRMSAAPAAKGYPLPRVDTSQKPRPALHRRGVLDLANSTQ